MKKIIYTALFVMMCSATMAQEGARIGIKGAYNNTWLFNKNVSDKNASMDYETSFGSSFGIQYVSMFSDNYGFSAEVNISSHSQEYNGEFDVLGSTVTYTMEDKLTFIDIPIMFRAGSEKGPYFEIGPEFSLLSGTKESFHASPYNSFMDEYDDKEFDDDFNSFGVGIVLGFGVDIKVTENVRISPGLRFGYTFTDNTVEYSEAELDALQLNDKASGNATVNHSTGSNLIGAGFGYESSHRAYGGLQVAVSYTF